MSTERTQTAPGDGLEIGPCRNAEQYAVEFLKQHDGPARPVRIADEYGCTRGYMQDVLRESDEIVRVGHGEYVLSAQGEASDGGTQFDLETGGEASHEATSEAPDDDTEVPRPSVGGALPLPDSDTTDLDDREGDDEMPTDEELERQRESAVDDESEEAADQDDGDDEQSDDDLVVEPVESEGSDESGEMGIPIPVSQKTLLLAVLAFLVFAWWKRKQSREALRRQQQQAQRAEQETEESGPDTPLIEGDY